MSDANNPDPERDARQLRFFTKLFADAELLTDAELADIELSEMERMKNLSEADLERELGIVAEGFDAVPWSVEELLALVERKAEERAKARAESGEKT